MIMLNFAELDEALAALEQDLGGDPSRLGEATQLPIYSLI